MNRTAIPPLAILRFGVQPGRWPVKRADGSKNKLWQCRFISEVLFATKTTKSY